MYVNVLGRAEVHTELQWGNLKERDCLKNVRGNWQLAMEHAKRSLKLFA